MYTQIYSCLNSHDLKHGLVYLRSINDQVTDLA